VYADRIPTTIEYLCEALDIDDPWVDYLVQKLKEKRQMLS